MVQHQPQQETRAGTQPSSVLQIVSRPTPETGGIAHPKKKKVLRLKTSFAPFRSWFVCFFTSAWLSLPEYPVVYSVKKLQEGSLQQLCELLGFANPSASPCPGGGFVPGCLLLLLDSQTESSCSAVKEIKPLKMTKFFFWFVPNFQKTSGQAPSRPAMAPLHHSLRRFVD